MIASAVERWMWKEDQKQGGWLYDERMEVNGGAVEPPTIIRHSA